MKRQHLLLALAAASLGVVSLGTTESRGALFTGAYSQNFDSMGQTGTTAPADWSYINLSGSHDLFSYSPPSSTTFLPSSTPTAINVGSGSSTATPNATLVAVTGPSNQRSQQGYNFGLAASPTDRALGTSPTGNAAGELQVRLTNSTGGDLGALNVSYDIRRFSTTTNNNTSYDSGPYRGIEELPGYWLFASLDNGASWTNLSSLNPTLAGPGGVIVPNAIGVTNVATTSVSLPSTWASNSDLLLRWVDDNAQSPSPDQLIALDNVTISSVPEPASAACAAMLAVAMSSFRRRRAMR